MNQVRNWGACEACLSGCGLPVFERRSILAITSITLLSNRVLRLFRAVILPTPCAVDGFGEPSYEGTVLHNLADGEQNATTPESANKLECRTFENVAACNTPYLLALQIVDHHPSGLSNEPFAAKV